MSASEARGGLSEAISKVAFGGERVVIQRRGKDVAALVSIEDLELLRQLEDESDRRAAKKARKEPRIPWETTKKKIGI